MLWRIEGFSSEGPPPPASIAPTPLIIAPNTYEDPRHLTRSAFVPNITAQCPSQFTRLAEFSTPQCGPQFFMRFKLHFVPGQNPVLAFCNAAGTTFFWDFKRLTVYRDWVEAMRNPKRDTKQQVPRPSWLKPVIPRNREPLVRPRDASRAKEPEQNNQMEGNSKENDEFAEFNAQTRESWTSRYSLEDPHAPLKAHKTEASAANFIGRQAAWSPGGEWCVIVGSKNTALMLQRWEKSK